MALISHRYKFIYFLNPRTASTATNAFLMDIAEGEEIPAQDIEDENGMIVVASKHTKPRQLVDHKLITQEVADTYLKFVTVRNPFDSLVSYWAKMNSSHKKMSNDAKSWVNRKPGYSERIEKSVGMSFPDWVKMRHGERYKNGEGSGINLPYIRGVDTTLYFENLQSDFAKVAEKLGLPGDHVIPQKNVTSDRDAKDYRSLYDDESRAIVEAVFAKELKMLGYTF